MSVPSIPANIHVDPNMHELIYRDLIAFSLVFDRTSLYAVSGKLLDLYFPLGHDGFIQLIEDLDDSPFVLTAPSDFYNQTARDERLNQAVMGWHRKFDGWIVNNRAGTGGLILADRSEKMRQEAWKHTHVYHKLVCEVLDNKIPARKLPANAQTQIRNAYAAAKLQFERDKMGRSDKPLSHKLPATFYDDIKHTTEYGKMLASGDVLSLLAFEHFTKPQIILSINPKFGKAYHGGSLHLYIPAFWHSILMQGLSLNSTAEIIPQRWASLIEMRENIGASILFDTTRQPSLDTILKTVPTRTVVQQIQKYRRNRGPQHFRQLIQESLERSTNVASAEAQAGVMKETIGRVRAICERYRYQPFLENVLLSSVLGAVALGASKMSRRDALKAALIAFAVESTTEVYKQFDVSARVEQFLGGADESARDLARLLPWWFSAAQPTETISTEGTLDAIFPI